MTTGMKNPFLFSLSFKRMLHSLAVPAVFLTLTVILGWIWPQVTRTANGTKEFQALVTILPLVPYMIFMILFFLGCRSSDAGIIFTSLTMSIFCFFLMNRGATPPPYGGLVGPTMYDAFTFLLPLNLFLFSSFTRRRILTTAGIALLALIALEISAVFLILHPADFPGSPALKKLSLLAPSAAQPLLTLSFKSSRFLERPSFHGIEMSMTAVMAFLVSFFLLSVIFLKKKNFIQAGFMGSLLTIFLALSTSRPISLMALYFSSAGLVLIAASFEASYSMAYQDDLTGLPARRSLNEELKNLGRKYAIAMIDIDHFKKFNDSYGHKTGDQVLRMVASKLSKISGGAKTFRYGGEEFTAVFPGKTEEEAFVHLEKFRRELENSAFVFRGKGRRSGSAEDRGKPPRSPQKRVKVTVSAGVASPDKEHSGPEEVLKAADKALYKAKRSGRNRVKSHNPAR